MRDRLFITSHNKQKRNLLQLINFVGKFQQFLNNHNHKKRFLKFFINAEKNPYFLLCRIYNIYLMEFHLPFYI